MNALYSKSDFAKLILQAYLDYQKTFSFNNAPKLSIEWFDDPKKTHSFSVTNYDYSRNTIIIRISKMAPIIYQLDFRACLFHEFTHIRDLVSCFNQANRNNSVFIDLSEIHASIIEIDTRIRLSEDEHISYETEIPVLGTYIRLKDYIESEINNIQEFYTNATTKHNLDCMARSWKHLLYYYGKWIYLYDKRLSFPFVINGIPESFCFALSSYAADIFKVNNLVDLFDSDIIKRIESTHDEYLKSFF